MTIEEQKTELCSLVSFQLWNFKDGGSKNARLLAKNPHTKDNSLEAHISF